MGTKSYQGLNIWKNGMEIVDRIYRITATFPRIESYGLTTQMRRSAISIPSNIAEGFARQHNREYKQFLFIALGSCAELETQIMIGFNQRYLSETVKEELLEKLNHESRMLMNMIKSVSKSLAENEQRTTSNE